MSRSVSVVIGFLMADRHLSFADAYDLVKKARPAAQPNEGFRRQLLVYEEDLKRAAVATSKAQAVHPLHSAWTLWYDRKSPKQNYQETLKKLGTFDTIEGLWE